MRTQVAYLNAGFLNTGASATATGATEPVTGLSIGTGVTLGDFYELTDGQAAQYSSKAVNSVTILTAGSGQTNGTYTATASTGSATISYTVAGNVVTAVSVVNGGNYPTGVAPTFTLAANGGTAGTVNATVGLLYSGIYQKVQLDPAIVTAVPVGTPLFWLQTVTGGYTVTSTATGNSPDFAGISIDPAFGVTPAGQFTQAYAWIQVNGKANVLYTTAPTAYGVAVGPASTSAGGFITAQATNPFYAGYSLVVGAGIIGINLTRIVRAQARY